MSLPADLGDRVLSWLADPGLPILLIIVVALIVIRFARNAVHGALMALFARQTAEGGAGELSAIEVQRRIDTLDSLGTTVIRVFVLVIALVMVLGQLGLDIGPAVAGLGIVGIAVGFGAQSLVRDYFNGVLILVENQFAKGDVISIAGVSGVVEDISLRCTTLRDLSGVVHTVPNGEIKVASNRTRTWARINEDVQVAYGTDLDRAVGVVNDVGRRLAEDPEWGPRVIEAPSVLRVDALGESGVTLKVLGVVRATEQWAVAGEFRRRLLDALLANGIEIPYPHRVVIARGEHDGAASGEGGA